MKKVLIVTSLFHSAPRIPGLCKYIREFGWEPVVLATPLGNDPEGRLGPANDFSKKFRVIEIGHFDLIFYLKKLAGFKTVEGTRAQLEKKLGGGKQSALKSLIRRLFILAGAIIAYPDELRFWRKPAAKAGRKILSEERFDAILTSSSPVTSHRVAKELKAFSKLPWVADQRDLWTQNHNYMYPKIRKFFETKLEMKTLSEADAFTTVSEPLVSHLKERYPNKKIRAIPNGFDPETVNDPPQSLTEKFTITYTGQIYPGKQDPTKILKAAKELIESKTIDPDRIEIRFYGPFQNWLEEDIKKLGLSQIARQYGPISRSEALLRQRESQVLLVFGWDDPVETGVFPTKLFEYFAARRPVLATGGTKSEKFRIMLEETRAGLDAINHEEIKELVKQYYQEYLKNGEVSYHGIPDKIGEYSYRSMAKKFAEVLNSVTAK